MIDSNRKARLLFCAALCAATASAVLAEQQPVTLKTVKVRGQAEEQADGPVQGYRATRSASGTRTDTPLLETPLSVQVVGREVMEDQQALSVGDTLRNVSGVYVRQGPDGNTMDSFSIRGFQADSYGATYLDGVKDFSRAPAELAGLERVEVLKGPAAIMYGRIEPGGMINRISKTPRAQPAHRLQQQLGSDNFLRTSLDSTGPLAPQSPWLYRINLVYENGDGYKDHTHRRRVYVAPQIEWRGGERSWIRSGVEYVDNDRSWALTYGTVGDADGPIDIDRETNLHGRDDDYQDESLAWYLAWEHAFNDHWTLRQRISYADRNSVARGSWIDPPDADGNYLRSYWGWEDEQAQVASANLGLTGHFTTGAVAHTLLLGVDWFDEDYDSGGWAYDGTPLETNIHNPDGYSAPYRRDYTVETYGYRNRHRGAYLQDQIKLFDGRLQLLLGLRHDAADYSSHYASPSFTLRDEELTWRAGALYRLLPSLSVYASYVEGFGRSNFDRSSGEIFDPETSRQSEIGLKVEITPAITLTAAAFRLVKDNLAMSDPADPNRSLLAGEATSDGAELDISGEIAPNWSVIAAYSYTDVRYTRSDHYQGERLHSVPRHGASLWTTYRFGSSGWEIGGGLVHRSDRLGLQRGDYPDLYPYTLDEYTLLDLMAARDFEAKGLPLRIQLNISNATDQRYHPSSYGGRGRIMQGEPRSALLAISISL